MYSKHYFLPQYEGEEEALASEPVETPKPDASTNLSECRNCGWVISSGTTVCPKCRRDPTKKFGAS